MLRWIDSRIEELFINKITKSRYGLTNNFCIAINEAQRDMFWIFCNTHIDFFVFLSIAFKCSRKSNLQFNIIAGCFWHAVCYARLLLYVKHLQGMLYVLRIVVLTKLVYLDQDWTSFSIEKTSALSYLNYCLTGLNMLLLNHKIEDVSSIYNFVLDNFFFYLDFLSWTFTNPKTAGEGGGHSLNSSLPLPPTSQTLRH